MRILGQTISSLELSQYLSLQISSRWFKTTLLLDRWLPGRVTFTIISCSSFEARAVILNDGLVDLVCDVDVLGLITIFVWVQRLGLILKTIV